jgi:periplasmic divalent cation tolerance protein
MTDARIVLTTTGSVEEARKLARLLVERRLVACVSIVPRIESVYRWKGQIEQGEECLLVMKTTAASFPKLSDAIRENHSYELPECVALNVEAGTESYLRWLTDSVSRQ